MYELIFFKKLTIQIIDDLSRHETETIIPIPGNPDSGVAY
jgi:hypothetical protein